MLEHAQVLALLDYDIDSGVFTNRVDRGSRSFQGVVAGYVNPLGYRLIGIDRTNYLAHRLAWFYVYGKWPSKFLDHINGKKDDNRLWNLREVNYKQNAENQKLHSRSKSGHRGVSWHRRKKKWSVVVRHHDKHHFVGYYAELNDAVKAAKFTRDLLFTHNKTEYSA